MPRPLGAANTAWHNIRTAPSKTACPQLAIIASADSEWVVMKVRWGILGTATIARDAVLPAMLKPEYGQHLEVAAIASRDLAKAQAVARNFGVDRAFGSYEALLADPGIDAVYIPLPNHLHVPFAILAIEAGKHVL